MSDRFRVYNRQEIDLRKEFSNTMYGSVQEIPKAYRVLLRKRRRDERGFHIPCVCNNNGEGSTLPACTQCLGEGYYWDESWADTFKYPIGAASANARRIALEAGGAPKPNLYQFFFDHTIDLRLDDRVIELRRDAEGDLQQPYLRQEIWKIQEVGEYRSDNGRLEFTIAFCSPINAIHNSYDRR